MGRVLKESSSEKLLGNGPVQLRMIDELLKMTEPIQQSKLARTVGTTETTVSRIMRGLTKDKKWKEVFKTDKIYQGRVYWIRKENLLAKKLMQLKDLLGEINEFES